MLYVACPRWRTVTCLVVLTALQSATVGWGQSTAGEIEARWRELQARESAPVAYRVTQDYTLMVPDRPRRHFEWQLEKGEAGGKLFRGTDHVLCWNEKYRFALMTKTGASQLILSDVTLGPSREANEAYTASPVHGLSGYMIKPYTYLLGDSLPDSLSSGKLNISAIRATAEGVQVKGVLRYTTHANTTAHYDLTLTLHPGDCRLKQVTADSKNKDGKLLANLTFRYSYLDTPQGPVIDRIDYTEGPVVPDGVFQFSPPTPYSAPPESFRLSHYDFPEPEGVVWEKSWPVPLYVWLLAGAGGFVALALGFTWLRSRRRPVTPSAPSPPASPQRGASS